MEKNNTYIGIVLSGYQLMIGEIDTAGNILRMKEYRLNFSSVLAHDELWARAGHEVSWEQFELKSWNVPAAPVPASGKRVRLQEDGDRIVASGEGFAYGFDARTGALVSAVVDGRELLAEPLRLNLWRAPLANELDGWNGRSAGPPKQTVRSA